jgi:aromatic-L-amino-acid/L-tryptophan decarboxylase
MDWAAQLLGLSPVFQNASKVGGGAIQVRSYLFIKALVHGPISYQSTASDSALIAAVAARSLYQRKHPEVKQDVLVFYTTTQTHSLGLKAGLILSLRVRALEVRPEDQYSLRGQTLRVALEEDIKAGRKPFMLIATVGSTSSGAIDNLSEIKEVGV